jgi:hypothetical protein
MGSRRGRFFGQKSSTVSDAGQPEAESKRILGIIPNYSTST